MIPEVLQFPVAVFWCVALLFVLFRRRLGFIWKFAALLLFVFYLVWFREPILVGLANFQNQFGPTLVIVCKEIWIDFGRSLILLTPVLLFIVFFKVSDKGSATLLRFLVVLSLFYWLFFFLFQSLPPNWADSIETKLPKKLEMPKMPEI
ncbi:MAG: hypothetical protein H3C43_04760 [Leptonema sp. (in: Bacteria)]|nr:hypothetical protein [Leptonema sp. (in: bacteria)]